MASMILSSGLPASGLTEQITLLSAWGWILSDPSLNLEPLLRGKIQLYFCCRGSQVDWRVKIRKRKGTIEMWEVPLEKLKVQLPPGFSLKEDPEFVYLFYGEERVAIFTSHADPEEIKKAAEKYLKG